MKTQVAKVDQLTGLAALARPGTTLKAAPYTLLGAYLGGTLPSLRWDRVLLAALVVCLIVAFGFVINDYLDLHVDVLSKSERPIPSGRVAPRSALLLAVGIACAGLAAAALLGPFLAIFALCAVILSALYSFSFKGVPLLGNATVALLDASIVVYGSYTSAGPSRVVWVVAVLTFLYILAFEILHNVADLTGDALAGLRTTGTHFGTANGLRLFQFVSGAFAASALASWLLGLTSDRFLYTVIPCTILPTIGIMVLLSERANEYTIGLSVRLLKIVWILSLLPVLVIR